MALNGPKRHFLGKNGQKWLFSRQIWAHPVKMRHVKTTMGGKIASKGYKRGIFRVKGAKSGQK